MLALPATRRLLLIMVGVTLPITSCRVSSIIQADAASIKRVQSNVAHVELKDGRQIDFMDDKGQIVLSKAVVRGLRLDGTPTTVDVLATDEIHFERGSATLDDLRDRLYDEDIDRTSTTLQSFNQRGIRRITQRTESSGERDVVFREGTANIDTVILGVSGVTRDGTKIDVPLQDATSVSYGKSRGPSFIGVLLGFVAFLAGLLIILWIMALLYAFSVG